MGKIARAPWPTAKQNQLPVVHRALNSWDPSVKLKSSKPNLPWPLPMSVLRTAPVMKVELLGPNGGAVETWGIIEGGAKQIQWPCPMAKSLSIQRNLSGHGVVLACLRWCQYRSVVGCSKNSHKSKNKFQVLGNHARVAEPGQVRCRLDPLEKNHGTWFHGCSHLENYDLFTSFTSNFSLCFCCWHPATFSVCWRFYAETCSPSRLFDLSEGLGKVTLTSQWLLGIGGEMVNWCNLQSCRSGHWGSFFEATTGNTRYEWWSCRHRTDDIDLKYVCHLTSINQQSIPTCVGWPTNFNHQMQPTATIKLRPWSYCVPMIVFCIAKVDCTPVILRWDFPWQKPSSYGGTHLWKPPVITMDSWDVNHSQWVVYSCYSHLTGNLT